MPSLLIVDDEADACRNLSDIPVDLGCRVDTVYDAIEAIEKLQTTQYDVTVLDFMMPGMDGVALYEKMREQCPETVAVLATAFPNHPRADEGLKAGIRDVISKPVEISRLMRLVGQGGR